MLFAISFAIGKILSMALPTMRFRLTSFSVSPSSPPVPGSYLPATRERSLGKQLASKDCAPLRLLPTFEITLGVQALQARIQPRAATRDLSRPALGNQAFPGFSLWIVGQKKRTEVRMFSPYVAVYLMLRFGDRWQPRRVGSYVECFIRLEITAQKPASRCGDNQPRDH